MAELALRFVAADERLSTILAGACQPHEIGQNTAAFLRGPLPADLHAAVEGIAQQF
jgi:aryl-alcohol dehydrogenase-like predicted oxidoreductase